MVHGIRIVEERQGTGAKAERRDVVHYELEISLTKGEVVIPRQRFETRLGSRNVIAGVEKALEGMHEGGYRKVKVSPHLAYREAGVEGKIPPNAVLVCQVWLKRVVKHVDKQP